MNIIEKYDKQLLYLMFLKCYHHLHPMAKSRVECVDQTWDAKNDMDIFEQPGSVFKYKYNKYNE